MKKIGFAILCFLFLSNSVFSQEELVEAYEEIDSMEKVLATLPEDTTRLEILAELATAYMHILEDSIFKIHADEHLKIAKDFQHPGGLNVAYTELIGNYMYSYPDVFESRVIEANTYFQEQKDTLGLIALMTDEAFHNAYQKKFGKAVVLLERADSLSEQIGTKEFKETIYSDLADIMFYTNNMEKTIAYANIVLQQDSFQSIENKARVLFFKGLALLDINQLDTVEQILKTSLSIFQETGDLYFIQQLYASLGDFYFKKNDIKKAKAYYKKTEPLAIINDCACTPLAENYFNIGKYHSLGEEYDSAKVYLKKSIEQAIREKKYDFVLTYHSSKAYFLLSKIYKKEGNYPLALQHFQTYHSFSDSLTKIDNNKTIKEFNIKYETKEKEQEITLLNKDNELLTAKNQTYLIATGSIALLTLVSVGFLANFRRKNQLITEQKSALEQLNSTKDQLFAIISHDLRKPALAFRGISQKVRFLLAQKEFDTLDKYGSSLEKAANSLNGLLDNLLKWALQQRDMLPYKPISINVAEVTEEIMELFENMAAEKNIALKTDIPEMTTAFVDQNAYATIIRNLIDNAIKFTPEGGMIELKVKEQASEVLLKVRDSGVGIAPKKLAKIFDLEKQKSTQGTAGEQGTGLGLSLVKDLVDLNKGTIKVQSQRQEGTTFELIFPAA